MQLPILEGPPTCLLRKVGQDSTNFVNDGADLSFTTFGKVTGRAVEVEIVDCLS